jgi:hypothetical protein
LKLRRPRGAADSKEADMAQVNEMDTAHERRYETPTFEPRSAFARTLRGGEMARLGLLEPQNGLPDPSELVGNEPDDARRVNGTGTSRSRMSRSSWNFATAPV